MSGIGFQELVILFLIGLIVLGPERLPRVANQIGSWLGQARRMTRVMKRQLEEELDLEKSRNIKPDSPPKDVFPPKSAQDLDPKAVVEQTPANEHDDSYSPAHDADDVGTGVDDAAAEPQQGEAEIPKDATSDAGEAEDSVKTKEETL